MNSDVSSPPLTVVCNTVEERVDTNPDMRKTQVKRAFLVVGPESSGTRLLTSLLIAGGCHGSAEHVQPFDSGEGGFGSLSPIVWRRSVPHNTDWKAWKNAFKALENTGYETTILVIVRNSVPCIRSQISVGLSLFHEDGEYTVLRALKKIVKELYDDDAERAERWSLVTYESLRSLSERQSILEFHGLDAKGAEWIEVRDENRKHWRKTSGCVEPVS